MDAAFFIGLIVLMVLETMKLTGTEPTPGYDQQHDSDIYITEEVTSED